MNGGVDGGREARFGAYAEQLARVLAHADRREPLNDLLSGLAAADRARERGADGGGHRAGAGGGKASVVAALCRQRAVVERSGDGQGERIAGAGDRTQRTNRGVDHRRHRISQEGPALGRCDAAVLRSPGGLRRSPRLAFVEE